MQLGFLFGSINEAKTAVPILEQAKINPIFVGGIVVLFTWASLIPITKGARSEAFGKIQALASNPSIKPFLHCVVKENQLSALNSVSYSFLTAYPFARYTDAFAALAWGSASFTLSY